MREGEVWKAESKEGGGVGWSVYVYDADGNALRLLASDVHEEEAKLIAAAPAAYAAGERFINSINAGEMGPELRALYDALAYRP